MTENISPAPAASRDGRRHQIISGILESVRVNGRASNSLQGAERAYAVAEPVLDSEFERGARAAATAMAYSLLDEDGSQIYPSLEPHTLRSLAGDAVAAALRDEGQAGANGASNG